MSAATCEELLLPAASDPFTVTWLVSDSAKSAFPAEDVLNSRPANRAVLSVTNWSSKNCQNNAKMRASFLSVWRVFNHLCLSLVLQIVQHVMSEL